MNSGNVDADVAGAVRAMVERCNAAGGNVVVPLAALASLEAVAQRALEARLAMAKHMAELVMDRYRSEAVTRRAVELRGQSEALAEDRSLVLVRIVELLDPWDLNGPWSAVDVPEVAKAIAAAMDLVAGREAKAPAEQPGPRAERQGRRGGNP